MKAKTENNNDLKSMGLSASILWFGFWSLVIGISYHIVLPRLDEVSGFAGFIITTTIPLACMFFTAIFIYPLENRSFKGFKNRYRITRINAKDVLWGIGISLIGMMAMGILSNVTVKLITEGIIKVPNNLPLLMDPNPVLNRANLSRFVGGDISGDWSIIFAYAIMLFFNIFGEELLWRGYILPRQEKAFGNKAWIIHGILWTLFHSFKWWDMLGMLPICLLTGYIAQKRKSIWPGVIAHSITNSMGLFLFIAAVLGLVK